MGKSVFAVLFAAVVLGAAWAPSASAAKVSVMTVCRQAPTSSKLFDAVIAGKPIEPFLQQQHPRMVPSAWLTRRLGKPRRVVWLSPVLARWHYGATVYWVVSLAASREIYVIGGKACAWA